MGFVRSAEFWVALRVSQTLESNGVFLGVDCIIPNLWMICLQYEACDIDTKLFSTWNSTPRKNLSFPRSLHLNLALISFLKLWRRQLLLVTMTMSSTQRIIKIIPLFSFLMYRHWSALLLTKLHEIKKIVNCLVPQFCRLL